MSSRPDATFKEAMIIEAKAIEAELRWKGTSRVSLETFASALANRASRHRYRRGAPCGTNAEWMFYEIAKEVYAEL